MHNKEQKILRYSMMLLFLALMIVYIVWYQVKGNELKKSMTPQTSWSSIEIISKTGDLMPTISSLSGDTQDLWFIQDTGTVPTTTRTTITANKTGIITPMTKSLTGTVIKGSSIKLLSGTSIYYGKIAIIDTLGIKYQYALTDDKGIWYIYLGTPSYDFASIARALKGDLYTLATEQELIQNKLFGNKVVYINLPEYKDKQVLMLVYMNDGIWLIQVEYSLYHKSKAYIKSLFTD